MKIVCAVGVEEARAASPEADVLVLPERTAIEEIWAAATLWPNAIIVGATEEGRHIRGDLIKDGIERIDYLKFSHDGASWGTNSVPASLTFETCSIAIGVLICKDFQHPDLRRIVMDHLGATAAPLRLVCIPADMGSEWFPASSVHLFPGAYLAVSNNRRMPSQTRLRSFVTGPDGICLLQQCHHEGITLDAP